MTGSARPSAPRWWASRWGSRSGSRSGSPWSPCCSPSVSRRPRGRDRPRRRWSDGRSGRVGRRRVGGRRRQQAAGRVGDQVGRLVADALLPQTQPGQDREHGGHGAEHREPGASAVVVHRAGARRRAAATRPAGAAGAGRQRGDETRVLEHPVPEDRGRGERGHAGEQGGRARDERAAARARTALVDVPGDPLADQRRELAVPVAEDAVQVATRVPRGPGDQERTDRPLDLVTQPAESHVGVVGAHAHGLAELGTLEALAQVQVEHRAVALVEPGGGVPHQGLEGLLLSHGLGPDCLVREVEQVVLPAVGGARARLQPSQALAPDDAVEPGTQAIGVAQLAQPFRGGHEGVRDRVHRVLALAQHRVGEVVQPVGVLVVDLGERVAVARQDPRHEVGVRHPRGPGHDGSLGRRSCARPRTRRTSFSSALVV